MIDLSEIGDELEDVPEHLRNEHVRYWLLFREWGLADVLERARALFEASGWVSEFHNEYEHFFRKDAHSVFLHVDTAPNSSITTRCPSGDVYEGPKWPETFRGKRILEVWRV